jgi:hypothetical protein
MSSVLVLYNFYFSCRVIAAESLTSPDPPLATDPAAVAVATALETSIITATVIAFAAVTITGVNTKNCTCDGQYINNCLHGGHVNVIEHNNKENAFPQVTVSTIISSGAKSSLHAYFEGVTWPLSKALPREAEFMSGP